MSQLSREIIHCPEVTRAWDDSSHPCSKVVRSQEATDLAGFQVPEPWTGKISTAPILFLSSNPSISGSEDYPRWSDEIDQSERFFDERFVSGSIRDGVRARNRDGSYPPRPTRFWTAVRRRAEEVLGRPAVPGDDYALSEIVHCKSRSEAGVRAALSHCATRYLGRILSESSAVLVVTYGDLVRTAVWDRYELAEAPLSEPIRVGGRNRRFVALGHPSGSKPQKFETCLTADELAEVRELVAAVVG